MDRKFPESGSGLDWPSLDWPWIGGFVIYEKRNNGNEFILPESTKMIPFGIIVYFYVLEWFVRPEDTVPQGIGLFGGDGLDCEHGLSSVWLNERIAIPKNTQKFTD